MARLHPNWLIGAGGIGFAVVLALATPWLLSLSCPWGAVVIALCVVAMVAGIYGARVKWGNRGPSAPRLEFLDELDYRLKPVETRDGHLIENGWFCGVCVVNRGNATARNVWAELTFLIPETGEPLTRMGTIKGRWASKRQPDADPPPVSTSNSRYTRIDIPANDEPEPLDLYVLFPGPSENAVYAYDNQNHMQLGRDWRYSLGDAPDHYFLVDVSIKGDDGVRLRSVWAIQALTPTPWDVEQWPI